MRTATLSLIFIVFVALQLRAQNGFYEPGFVLIKGDTLRGFVERTDEIKLSHAVSFKDRLEELTPKSYAPLEIDGFGFDKSKQSFSPVEVTIYANSKARNEHRFAKNLLKGETSLYKLQHSGSEKKDILLKDDSYLYLLYVIKKDDKFYTLGQYEYTHENRVGLDKKYIGILKALLNDCLNSHTDITEKLKFTDEALIQLLEKYNNCKNPEVVTTLYSHKVKPINIHGPTISFTKLYSHNQNIANTHGYSAGYFWDIERQDRSRTITESIGINYLHLRYDHVYYTIRRWNKPSERVEVPQQMHFIRVPLQGQINFLKDRGTLFLPFINGGITVQFSTSNSFDHVEMIPFICVGGGAYVKRLKVFTTLENIGFSYRSDKLLNVGIGMRLDQRKTSLPQ